MTKADMLVEYITQDIVAQLMQDEHLDMAEALRQFYLSETFRKLTDPETGLYIDSSASVYALFKDERKYGRLVQNEI